MKLASFHLCLPKQGESVSGDAAIARSDGGAVLLAVIDALGHGPLAAVVAERSREYLLAAPLSLDVRSLMEGLHDALRGTRGAAGMCCILRGGRLEGCGVGNVEMRSTVSRVPVVLTPGIIGVRHQPMRVFQASLEVGARILIFSDGLSPRMDVDGCSALHAEEACNELMNRYRKLHDDATLLIADVEGLAAEGASR